MMENQPHTIGSLIEDAGNYLETRIDLLKLKAVDKSSEAASSIVSGLATVVLVIFAMALLNVGLALWIGDLLGKSYLGFFAMAGLYVLLAVLLYIFKDSWIKQPLSTMIIKKMLN